MHKKRVCKKLQGSRKLPQAHENVCDENERNKEKNDTHVKMLLMEGCTL